MDYFNEVKKTPAFKHDGDITWVIASFRFFFPLKLQGNICRSPSNAFLVSLAAQVAITHYPFSDTKMNHN